MWWILRAAYPRTVADVAADVPQEDVGINPTPSTQSGAASWDWTISSTQSLSWGGEQFGGMAGKPIRTGWPTVSGIYQQNIGQDNQPTNIYAPFSFQTDWEFTRWAKLCGPTSTAVIDLLNIPGARIYFSSSWFLLNWLSRSMSLGLSYKTSNELNAIVDKLSGRPEFKTSHNGRCSVLYLALDILECIQPQTTDQYCWLPRYLDMPLQWNRWIMVCGQMSCRMAKTMRRAYLLYSTQCFSSLTCWDSWWGEKGEVKLMGSLATYIERFSHTNYS